jgi:phosphoglycolate phosphatase
MLTERPVLLFDLDGTLTDSRPGIFNSFRYTFDKLGRPQPSEAVLNRFLGPPIRTALQDNLGMSPGEAEEAIAVYREYFAEKGLLENDLYPGIPELLDTLASSGFILAVATSKPEVYARRILDHFGLAAPFAVVCGSELDGRRDTKGLVIEETLKRLEDSGIPVRSSRYPAVMIGDRHHDIAGGREHGLATIGVLFGYGTREELAAAGADRLAETAADIGTIVNRGDFPVARQ